MICCKNAKHEGIQITSLSLSCEGWGGAFIDEMECGMQERNKIIELREISVTYPTGTVHSFWGERSFDFEWEQLLWKEM